MSADVQTVETPSMLDDKYRIESLLAVGGMGAVYRGRHTKLQKTVAIKILKRELLSTPEIVERFQREAVAASQIGHEGIIEVTDIGTSNAGDPFLVMEFLEGSDLAACLHAAERFEPGTAVRLCIEILSALGAAHDKNIIHRDLKPENTFVCKRSGGERIKIVDFGISRISIEGDESMRLTTTGMVMGTPYYMSPEQALGEGVEKAADIYSVGVMLYELITGALPYQATNYNALLHQILLGVYSLPSQLSAIAPELEAVIVKAMSKLPEDRYPDARAFSEALKPFAEASPTSVLPSDASVKGNADGTEPHFATAPTRASSVGDSIAVKGENIATMETACVTETPETNTLKPVVTSVPSAPVHRSSRKTFAAIAVVGLLAIGGVSALMIGGNQQEKTSASAPQPTPTAATPTAPPTTITISFTVAPEDAQIFVDGTLIVGKSVERPPGKFVVEVRQDGFVSQERTVEVGADEQLAFALVADAAKLPALAAEDPEPSRRSTRRKSLKRNNKQREKQSDEPTQKTKSTNRRFVEDSPYDAP
tara:strand:+ start:2933 stop:4546 length:1614 start_codon:yes stop_codon:yes gene_type:complete